MKKKEWDMESTNGKNRLHVVMWQPEKEIKAVVQLSHGMIEYVNRYERFGSYLAEQGIVLVGNDHLGHGESVNNQEEYGYFGVADGGRIVVKDLYELTKQMKKAFPGIPYFVLGHSMGSFMIRRYLMHYGESVDGAILMGTGRKSSAILVAGELLSGMMKKFKGDRYRSNLMNQLSFGLYNKKIKPVQTKNDWLSRDKKVVERYNKDPYCTFLFTLNGFDTIFTTLSYIQKKENMYRIPTELPIFMLAGTGDPVGDYGKGVKKIYSEYKKIGLKRVTIKLYQEYRHELLNEIGYEVVQRDLLNWLESQIENRKKY